MLAAKLLAATSGAGTPGYLWGPRFIRESFLGIASSGSLTVAVAGAGAIYTSTDGITWTKRVSNTTASLTWVIWANSQFVAVGGSTCLTSPDGITWTSRSGMSNAIGLTWSGTIYLTAGTSGTMRASSDGITWTSRSSGTSTTFNAVVYGTRFVAVGFSGMIRTSTDGTTWTPRASGTSSALYDVAWSGSRYVAVGGFGEILWSNDGFTWNFATVPAGLSGTTFYGVTWGNSQFVAVSWDGVGSSGIYTSPDGLTWSTQSVGAYSYFTVGWTGSQYVAMGSVVSTSPDGSTWTYRMTGTQRGLYGITETSGGYLVAVGAGGTVITSSDAGVTWNLQFPGTLENLNAVVWSGTKIIAVGANGTIVVCNNNLGNSWTAATSGTSAALDSVIWDGALFWAVGDGGIALTSSNGTSWSSFIPALAVNATGIAFSSSVFVYIISYSDGRLAYSIDGGFSWITTVFSPSGVAITNVVWTGAEFVLTCASGTVRISTNGTSWTTRTSAQTGTSVILYGAVRCGSVLAVVGNSGVITVSTNGGSTWTVRSSNAPNDLYSAILSVTNNKAYVAGLSGQIVYSPPSAIITL